MQDDARPRSGFIALLRRWSWVRAPALSPYKPFTNIGLQKHPETEIEAAIRKSDTKVILFPGIPCDTLRHLAQAVSLQLQWDTTCSAAHIKRSSLLTHDTGAFSIIRKVYRIRAKDGMVEGQIHRLKLIKRQMYGRAGFDLLRLRVLHSS
jgi:hypothetical protein